MKQVLFILICSFFFFTTEAQNVGIGTTTPDAKAALEINSTTKGLLIPSMTTSQRLAITVSTPAPNGLMVYDTDRDEFYHYNGSSWSPILNGSYWTRPIASRKRISNTLDSVGIGTVSPTEWLDVDGNIRSRNNLLADNNIIATGNVSGANVSTPGNITVVGTSFFNGNTTVNSNLSVGGTSLLTGDVTTNSDLIINNAAATLQLKNSNINKGFFQLSGVANNVRMGTNSGNSTGNLIIRMNGNDRVEINPAGDINIEGKITKTAVTGFNNLLPLCYGYIFRDGAIQFGTENFIVEKLGPGYYRINCTGISYTNTVVIANARTRNRLVAATLVEANYFEILVTDRTDVEIDGDFYFVVYKL
jgi:trimeric autotransporter adhesin